MTNKDESSKFGKNYDYSKDGAEDYGNMTGSCDLGLIMQDMDAKNIRAGIGMDEGFAIASADDGTSGDLPVVVIKHIRMTEYGQAISEDSPESFLDMFMQESIEESQGDLLKNKNIMPLIATPHFLTSCIQTCLSVAGQKDSGIDHRRLAILLRKEAENLENSGQKKYSNEPCDPNDAEHLLVGKIKAISQDDRDGTPVILYSTEIGDRLIEFNSMHSVAETVQVLVKSLISEEKNQQVARLLHEGSMEVIQGKVESSLTQEMEKRRNGN